MNEENEYVTRPWGAYEVIGISAFHQVKHLTIDPYQRLSDQRHKHRSETWMPINDVLEVELHGHFITVAPGRTLSIGPGAWHRLRNPNEKPLIVVEIQTGRSFEEEDIERRDDDYGRA